MRNNRSTLLPYRFLPATTTLSEAAPLDEQSLTTFSSFLRQSIFNADQVSQKISRIKLKRLINDTGIRACGALLEHVEQLYIHTWPSNQHEYKIEGSVILVVKNPNTLQRHFFKGIWDPTKLDISVWYELSPEIAELEIARLDPSAEKS